MIRGAYLLISARGRKDALHRVQDLEARFAGLLHRLLEDAKREALELEIELEPGDALLGARDLAVHVAERVLPADDVGEQLVAGELPVVVVLRADADADAGDRADDRDAGVHEGEGAGTDGGHRGGAVGLHDLGGDTDGVGILLERDHRLDAALGQGAVADFATAGTHDAAGFADGEIREVVVEQELLLAGTAGVGVEFLDVLGGAEGDQGEGLGFAAREEAEPWARGSRTGFAADRARRSSAAAVEALALIEDQAADGFLLDVVEGVLDDEVVDLLGGPNNSTSLAPISVSMALQAASRASLPGSAGRR
jgi:hypothetical protein